LVEKVQDFTQSVRVCGVPEIGAFAADVDQTDLLQFLEMMRKSGSGDAEFLLDFAGDHAGGVSGKEEAENPETRLRAEGGEAVRGTRDEQRIRFGHLSIIAEIRKNVNPGPAPQRFFISRHPKCRAGQALDTPQATGNANAFGF
jgi:hypothetical protein